MVAIMRGVQGSYIIPTGSDTPRTLADLSRITVRRNRVGPRVIAALGDSITARANTTAGGGNIVQWDDKGYITWVRRLTQQRFRFPKAYNFGVNGANAGGILSSQLPLLLATDPLPDIALIHCMTNDTYNNLTVQKSIDDVTDILDALEDAGIMAIMIPVTGRSSSLAFDSTQIKQANYRNNWLKEQQYVRRNLMVVDLGVAFDDPSSATWVDRSGMTEDGLHSGALGAYTLGKAVSDVLNTLYPVPAYYPCTNSEDLYDATNNPYGVLGTSPNPMMLGTSGTKGGSVTGTVADNWRVADISAGGATVAASKSTMTDGRVAQQVAISGTYSGTARVVEIIRDLTTTTGLVDGDIAVMEASIEVAASSQNLCYVRSFLMTVEGGTTYRSADGASDQDADSEFAPSAGWSGVIRTRPRTITATPTGVYLVIYIGLRDSGTSASVAATVKVSSACVRKNLPTYTLEASA